MSYRISYDCNYGATKNKDKHFSERGRIFFRLIVVMILCGVGVWILRGSTYSFAEYLIPGDPETTKEAFGTMVGQIKEGNSVKEAIAAFCREVVADVKP